MIHLISCDVYSSLLNNVIQLTKIQYFSSNDGKLLVNHLYITKFSKLE